MLKIDDAAYLKPGQRAWLVRTGAPNGKVAWAFTAKKGALVELNYAKTGAVSIQRAGKQEAVAFDKPLPLDADLDLRVQETQVSAGVNGVRAFVFNQKNAAPAAFKGVIYFPYDPAWKLDAAFVPSKATPVDFQTSRGTTKRFWHVGAAQFSVKGQAMSLPMYAEDEKGGGLSAFFLDANSGKVTYGAGRYIDAQASGAFPPKSVTLDFNYAYNPNCARSPFYTCPLTKDRLPVAVNAGEKAPPGH
jgi:uncharacterized protein (DUF1684 family)